MEAIDIVNELIALMTEVASSFWDDTYIPMEGKNYCQGYLTVERLDEIKARMKELQEHIDALHRKGR